LRLRTHGEKSVALTIKSGLPLRQNVRFKNAIYKTVEDQLISKCVFCCKSYVYYSTVYTRKSTFGRNCFDDLRLFPLSINLVTVKEPGYLSQYGDCATGWMNQIWSFGFQFSSSSQRPGRLWGPISLLSNGYRWLFLRGSSGRWLKLIISLQLLPKLKTLGCAYFVALN
jgi:hypothetical protein